MFFIPVHATDGNLLEKRNEKKIEWDEYRTEQNKQNKMLWDSNKLQKPELN